MIGRLDGRGATELRPVRVTRNYLKHSMGSCIFELGDTRVLCAASIEEGVSSWRRGSGMGWVTAEYSMLPASTHTRSRREMSGPKGRTHEIQRLIGRSLRTVVDMAAMGESTLTVDCDVIQADGGTRCAAITGAWLAVHDALIAWRDSGKIASVPLLGQVAATSVGLVDGGLLLDLAYSEDSVAEVDMNVVMDNEGRYIEVQGTGEQTPFDRARLDALLDLAGSGIGKLLEVQRAVIDGELQSYGF
ncbi:MAG: ribonuclease PH [Actinobacteria bacterium HGW-Actinobacteria-7]|nr:MAG: ribonuclease PH [Actinobacteria bacterium HGW-Actinobacteria-7]